MRLSRLKTVVIFAVAAVLGTALLQISRHVQEAQIEMAKLEARLAKEQETMRVLQAEWAFLNSPARLEGLAQEYLGLEAPDVARIATSGEALPQQEQSILMHEISAQPASMVLVRPARKPVRKMQVHDFDDLLEEIAP